MPTDIRASQADPRGPSEGSYRTEVWYRAAVSISTAYDTLDKFARQTARGKAVIYVSSGYGVDPLPDRSPTVIGTKPGVTSPNNISAAGGSRATLRAHCPRETLERDRLCD